MTSPARPFHVITTVLLLAVSAFTLFRPPTPMPVARLPLFLTLLVIHLALHWLSGLFVARRGAAYLAIQALLAFALALVSQRPELTLALFAALLAETIGLFGFSTLGSLAIVGYGLLTALGFYTIGGAPLLASWLPPSLSTIVLLIAFMALYRRQEEARQRSEALLLELEQAHLQLSAYAVQVEDLTLSNERQRMARELHDTLSQGVAGIVLQLEAANAHLENGSLDRAAAIIALSLRRARSTLAESRAAIDDLRQHDRNLPQAVRRHTERFTAATGIPCHVTVALPPSTQAPPPVVDHVERIIGESLANITRHAQACNVWLVLEMRDNNLHLVIRDDGGGFNVTEAQNQGHYGLLGMRERARLLGGTFDVSSELGKGSRLSVTLPLEAS